MINWFDMPAEGLSNGGQFEVKELTATENKVYEKAGEVYNKVTVNVEGGGGSSDDALSLSVLYTAPAIDGAYSGTASRGYVSLTIPNYLPFSAFPKGAHLPFVIKKGVQTIIVTGAQRSANVTFKEHTIENWTENTGGFAYVTEGDDGFDLKIFNANTGDASGTVTVNVNMPSVKFMIPSDLSVFAES